MHEEFPSASISILVRKGNEGIYANHPFLKEVLVWDKKTNKYKNLLQLLFKIRKSKFDLVINCHRYASSGFLTAFSGANHKAGLKQSAFSYMLDYAPKHSFIVGEHEINRYHKLVEDFASNKVFKPKIYPTVNDELAIEKYTNANYVCMAPSSVWFTKQLPKHKWIELCNLISENTTIYLLGAPSDKKLAEEIISESKHKQVINLCGQLTLLQSTALMKKARMNYVNDSAPLHLASAVNAPTTAFFCSTIKDFGFYPLSDSSKIVDAGKMDCRPCGLHGFNSCPKKHFNCGNFIKIEPNLAS